MNKKEKNTLLQDIKKVNHKNIIDIFKDLKDKYEDFEEFTFDNSLMTINNAVNLITQTMKNSNTNPDYYYFLADNLVKIVDNSDFNYLVSFGCNSLVDNSKRTDLYNVNEFKGMLKDFINGNY